MVKTMNKDAIIFACANPTPEIFPEEARAGGAIRATPDFRAASATALATAGPTRLSNALGMI